MQQHTDTASSTRSSLKAPALVVAGISLALASHASAEVEQELGALVVSALRFPTEASKVTSSVSVLDPEDLRDRGVFDLETALNESPGVISTSTSGQAGAIGSLFIRGTTTTYSQIVVDGVRLSDSTAALGNFLGTARIDDIDRIEVLRGPQSAFYGGEAVGGVVWLETAHGTGTPSGRLRVEGGSFDSATVYGSEQGQIGALSWFVGGGYDHTHNDAPGTEWEQGRAALRAEWQVNKDIALGMTYRLTDSRYDYHYSGQNVDHLDANLATIYADTKFSEKWTARHIIGFYDERYDNDTFGMYGGNYGTDLQRLSFSTDHSYQLNEQNRILAGASFENTDFVNTSNVDENRDRYGVHVGWEYTPIEELTTHAALRWEDYDAYGDEVTWHAGAGYRIKQTETLVRAGVGRAFRTPTYLDLFGTTWAPGNPDLKAESSIGWDFGIEQPIAKDHLIAITYFDNSIEDRIKPPVYNFPLPTTPPVNLSGETPTRGVEVGLHGSFLDKQWRYRAACTFLGESLADQPENVLTASLDWHPTDKWILGTGVSYLDDRSWGGTEIAAYTLARFYGTYQATENLAINARVENAFNESYELSNFSGTVQQGAGTGVYGGVTVTW